MNDLGRVDETIASADSEFPALFQLFGGYFHQDWRDEHASPASAISAFIGEAPRDAILAAGAELDRLLAAGFSDDELARVLGEGFGGNYLPEHDGLTVSQWLAEIRASLRGGRSH
jgi:hypothetical protein